jgi:hypothetical protein
MPTIQLKLEGSWSTAISAIDGVPQAIQKGYDTAMSRISRQILQIIKEAIDNGGPDNAKWEPLATSTLSSYISHKIPTSGMPWNRTGQLRDSISLYRYGNRTYIGVKRNSRPNYSNYTNQLPLTFTQIARILEYGTRGTPFIPARPLFAPSLQAWAKGKTPSERIKKDILAEVKKQLKKLGFKPSQVAYD